MKTLSWEEYFSSKQEIYLNNENSADYAVMRKYEDDDEIVTVTASAMKGYCNEDHWFSGGDDDYVIIDYPYDGPSYLLYGGSWNDVDEYMKSEGFHLL